MPRTRRLASLDQDSANALLAAKIQRNELVHFETNGKGQTAEDVLQPLVDAGLVSLGRPFMRAAVADLTAEGVEAAASVTPAMLTGAQNSPAARAQAAMWLFLLLNGHTPGSYGSTHPFGERGEIAHVLTCGLDLTRSSSVSDDTWSSWGGTFSSDNRHVGISGEASCRCGQVMRHSVKHEVESIADLLAQTLAL